ncbi:MAG: FtsL-like putative cell division protein [Bacteroidota bacterium]
MKNEVREVKEVKVKKQKPKRERKVRTGNSRVMRYIISIIDGTFLTRDNFLRQLPFIFFIAFIALCYIGSTYYAEKMVREIDETKGNLKELRSEHISLKSELMEKSKQSEIARRVADLMIKESTTPPDKIVLDQKTQNEFKKLNK